jgi:hypothetical protein
VDVYCLFCGHLADGEHAITCPLWLSKETRAIHAAIALFADALVELKAAARALL